MSNNRKGKKELGGGVKIGRVRGRESILYIVHEVYAVTCWLLMLTVHPCLYICDSVVLFVCPFVSVSIHRTRHLVCTVFVFVSVLLLLT